MVVYFIVEAEDGSKSVYAHGAGDSYKVTSKLVSEAALCLVETPTPCPGRRHGGVHQRLGLGQALIDRLSKNGIRSGPAIGRTSRAGQTQQRGV